MSKRSKSKRFVQQGSDSVKKHEERFPFRTTLAETDENHERQKMRDNSYLGGI